MARHVANQAEKAMGDKLLKDIEGSKEDFVESTVTSASSNGDVPTSGADGTASTSSTNIGEPFTTDASALPPPPASAADSNGNNIAGAVAAVSSSPSGSDPLQPGSNAPIATTPTVTPADENGQKKPTKHCWFYIWCRTY